MTTAFFYGILMHPKILKRVLNNDASHLRICPAILTNYTRHKVKFEDYPAIIPSERSQRLLGRELTAEENSVRGTLVAGLTAKDITLLDVFEGYMYDRLQVLAHPLGPYTHIPTDDVPTSEAVEDSLNPTALSPLATIGELAPPIEAQTYVWCVEDNRLDKELWSFDEFVRKNTGKWIGGGAEENEDYREVDKVKERMNEETAPNGA